MLIKSIKINKSYIIFASVSIIIITTLLCISIFLPYSLPANSSGIIWNTIEDSNNKSDEKKYIKWVDFSVTYDALDKTSKLDINSHVNL